MIAEYGLKMATQVGFEPTVALTTADFKSAAINQTRPLRQKARHKKGTANRIRTGIAALLGRSHIQLDYLGNFFHLLKVS